MRRGAYFLANDRILDLVIAFLNSFRKHNPDFPLCLIPFNNDISKLEQLQSSYDFSIFANRRVLEKCDGISVALHQEVVGQYRKIAMWEGGFDEFVYIDTDTVILQSVDFVFDFLGEAEFVTSHSNLRHIRKWVWKDSVSGTGKLAEEQIAYSANMGFIVSRASALSIEEALAKLPSAVELSPHMVLFCTDQPFLNYLMVTSGRRYTSLLAIAKQTGRNDIPQELWAGDRSGFVFAGRVFRPWKDRAFIVHWAGVWHPKPWQWKIVLRLKARGILKSVPVTRFFMPYKRLWNYYRYLR